MHFWIRGRRASLLLQLACVAALQDSNIQLFVYSIFVLLIHLSGRESQVRSVPSAGHRVVLFDFVPPSIHESTLFSSQLLALLISDQIRHNRPSVFDVFWRFAGFRYRESQGTHCCCTANTELSFLWETRTRKLFVIQLPFSFHTLAFRFVPYLLELSQASFRSFQTLCSLVCLLFFHHLYERVQFSGVLMQKRTTDTFSSRSLSKIDARSECES